MLVRRLTPLIVLSLVVLTGHVTDKTTSQPLAGVHLTLTGPQSARAATAADGGYRIAKLRPGRYVVTLSSPDVPPQRFDVTLGKAPTQARDFVACSTTLDFSCAGSL